MGERNSRGNSARKLTTVLFFIRKNNIKKPKSSRKKITFEKKNQVPHLPCASQKISFSTYGVNGQQIKNWSQLSLGDKGQKGGDNR